MVSAAAAAFVLFLEGAGAGRAPAGPNGPGAGVGAPAPYFFVFSLVLAVIAIALRVGWWRAVTVIIDARSVFLVRGEAGKQGEERRIPRRTVAGGGLVGLRSAEVEVQLSSGEILRMALPSRAEARRLAAALGLEKA